MAGPYTGIGHFIECVVKLEIYTYFVGTSLRHVSLAVKYLYIRYIETYPYMMNDI